MDGILKLFDDNKIVAVIRSSSAEDAESMLKAAIAGGLRLIEVSTQTPQALRLVETYSKKENLIVGAGSVTDGEMAQRAVKSGARFISSHYTELDVISVAKNNDAFVIQGAMTPTEAVTAYQAGADLVKIYPAASAGGPEYLKYLKGPLSFLKLVASGGVTLENAFEYLKYCVAVYIGKGLFDKSLVRANGWSEITERARQLTQKLETAKVSR